MDAKELAERERVLDVAHSWIGTPYHDMGEIKGVGVDCAKLVYLVYHEAGLCPAIKIEDYSPQFMMHSDEEKYLTIVATHAREITLEHAAFGDLVLYKIGRVFSHGAIIIKPGWSHIIHAHFRSKCVVRARGLDGALGAPKVEKKFFTQW
jgi:cell wall-associated NlpC family hydrolase